MAELFVHDLLLLQCSKNLQEIPAYLFSRISFILTTEFISGTFPAVLANLRNRSYAGRIHREDKNA